VRKAAGGDVRCMLKTLELRHQFADTELKERLETLGQYIDAIEGYRKNPDDMPQHIYEAMMKLRVSLKDFLPPSL
jgi:hypothetical protein